MLKIEDLSYRYSTRRQPTLRGVSLELADGEMLLLAGRSGCGKSTLIKAVSGLLGSEERGELQGRIYLDGEDVTQWPPERIGLYAGTVYQSPDDQLFAMTVADEVGFALENQGVEPVELRQRVAEALRLVGLGGLEASSIHQLSGGQRQRLALASILVMRPRLLILDEPVSQLNPQGVQGLMELLLRLNREYGLAVLLIEHRVNELYKYFSRLAVMQDGRLLYDGALEEAWQALGGRQDLGLREPQTVKLCRELGLAQLVSSPERAAALVRSECVVNRSAQPPLSQAGVGGTPLLTASELVYRYPAAPQPTLNRLSLTLRSGEITALMGFNGAGKSTLLNLLGGLAQPTAGELLLDGVPVRRALGQVGYLRQEPDLMLLADSVREELCWKNKALGEAELLQLLAELQLTEYAEDFPLALSKGQRLRVVLGAMLAKRPRLLLLDEPTSGQDEQSLGEIRRLLLDFRRQGGSILLCTHDSELAAQLADRVLLLAAGRLIADGPPQTVLADKELLRQGGLTPPPLLAVCEELGLPPCVTLEEVLRYVRKTAVGGQ